MPNSQTLDNINTANTLDEDKNYKRLSSDMHEGLKDIYRQINRASSDDAPANAETADMLFTEAAEHLSQVLESTQSATESIMEKVEVHLDTQYEMLNIIRSIRNGDASADQIDNLESMVNLLGEDLTSILTALSFQDLTGQRIKKVVTALKQIENTVVHLYLSSGLIMKGLEESPTKKIDDIKKEADDAMRNLKDGKQVSSTLKGPSQDSASQGDIDDLLAQLGM